MLKFGSVNYIFGSPGAGKTTVLSKLARYYIKRGIPTYANFPCKGCILIQDEDIGYYNFTNSSAPFSVLLIDEAGVCLSNRDAFCKNALMNDKKRLSFWKLCRHYKTVIWMASQSWEDVDKKCRDLSNRYFYIKRSLFPFYTVVKPIFKCVDIDETTHQPADFYKFDLFFNWMWVFRPRWYKYFDSYDCPELPDYPKQDPV